MLTADWPVDAAGWNILVHQHGPDGEEEEAQVTEDDQHSWDYEAEKKTV